MKVAEKQFPLSFKRQLLKFYRSFIAGVSRSSQEFFFFLMGSLVIKENVQGASDSLLPCEAS